MKMRRCEDEKVRYRPTIGRTLRSDALGNNIKVGTPSFGRGFPCNMSSTFKLSLVVARPLITHLHSNGHSLKVALQCVHIIFVYIICKICISI